MNDTANIRPIFVDLDGTLLATDTLWELLVLLLRQRPAIMLKLPFWFLQGRAVFKKKIAEYVSLDPATLPYRESVMSYLAEQKQAGRQIVLATGADQHIAESIAEHLQLFDHVIASDGVISRTGYQKLQAIREYAGNKDFDYMGDSIQDLPVWKESKRALLVEPSAFVLSRVHNGGGSTQVFGSPKGRTWDVLRAMRLSHWSKNLLLAAPLVVGHYISDLSKLVILLVAFISFGFCASAVYVLNDLADLAADRQHPTKQLRPFACGRLKVQTGLLLVLILVPCAFLLAVIGGLPSSFIGILGIYFILTTTYSLCLKRKVIVDVLLLAGLYTVRIVAGGWAIDVIVTPWLLAFSAFLFVSLAFAKRYTELLLQQSQSSSRAGGRGYQAEDLETVGSFGATSGYMAVLVFCLYITSDQMTQLYSEENRWRLWLICPILLYWISRVWLRTRRGWMHSDPVVFALTDWVSYASALLIFVVVLLAK